MLIRMSNLLTQQDLSRLSMEAVGARSHAKEDRKVESRRDCGPNRRKNRTGRQSVHKDYARVKRPC